jgi:hypothetical protein
MFNGPRAKEAGAFYLGWAVARRAIKDKPSNNTKYWRENANVC